MIAFPSDIVLRLFATGFNIVALHTVTKPGGGNRGGSGVFRLDSVWGTKLINRADLHREYLGFPPFAHGTPTGRVCKRAGAWEQGETEGTEITVSDMGAQCRGLPGLEVLDYLD